MANDSVYLGIDGWYFWDETWSNAIGPYLNEVMCRESAIAYGKYLDDGKTEDPNKAARAALEEENFLKSRIQT